ncbi:DUF6941 family protein [Bradyrhizobium sp. cf659]|uniref:DUF6941 family protein n=1 Tax=Bradyrhizobium sp. cf659 TaxID=1761771 RepID=UPI000B805895|nr:hypothetical protein [Bradyrhizobium sp. cf659]
MIEVDTPEVYGYTIFCDDIRFEQQGKITLVGIYGGSLIIHGEFPTTLPKFGIHVNFRQHKSAYASGLKLLIFLPGDSEEKASFEIEMDSPPDAVDGLPPTMSVVGTIANVVLSPLVLPTTGPIKVRMIRDGKLYKLGSLFVEAIASNDSQSSSEQSPPVARGS